MKKILMFLPYFGKFPNYFSFWVESVKFNPTINWLIFTDNTLLDVPPNLKVVNTTFESFKSQIQEFFPFDISLNSPYKLCDYKVVYGLAFKEYLVNYDFWGFCDCDLIWGNIRSFVTDQMLDNYDHLFGLGPFQLQRVNDNSYLQIMKNAKAKGKYDFKHVFTHSKNFVFDELPHGVSYQYYVEREKKYYNEFSPTKRPYDSPQPNYYHFIDGYNSINELGKAYKKTMFYVYRGKVKFWDRKLDENNIKRKNIIYRYYKGNLEKLFVKDGKVNSEELMYVHFRQRGFQIKTRNKENYMIVPNKIMEFKKEISLLFMFKHGRRRLFDWRLLEIGFLRKKLLFLVKKAYMKFLN